MIVQVTLTRNELFLIKEMLPQWQKYADAFVFMVDRSDDGTYEFLVENKDKYNILSVLKTNWEMDGLTVETDERQRLYDEAFKHSGNIICLDTDEYLDGNITKGQLEDLMNHNKDVLIHARWIQYTDKNKIRVDGPWGINYKDRIGSYSKRHLFKPAQTHSEHLPVPEKQGVLQIPDIFISHLPWLCKETVAIKQYYWKICDYVNRVKFKTDTIPASAYDESVNNFDWELEEFNFDLKIDPNIYSKDNNKNSFKMKFIRENIEKHNIPNLNDWNMGIHSGVALK